MAYENAAPNFDENDGVLKININLSDKVTTAPTSNDQWQLMPDYIGADKTAYFYYTGILGAGETSSMLIDSVELDSSVTEDMFKYFDFDLNVGLKSAQIAMDSDGKTILTTAADNTLDANATLATPTSVDTKVTWAGDAPAAANSYAAKAKAWVVADNDYTGEEIDVTITKLATPVTVNGEPCMYVINSNYYGSGLTTGKVFTKATEDSENPGTYNASTTEKIKLTANAVPVTATP